MENIFTAATNDRGGKNEPGSTTPAIEILTLQGGISYGSL
jgi:hypothetical protein